MSDPKPRQRITKGSPGWMVTFADMMSLLLCLFILILSFAKVDSNQFRKNAGPINQAFGVSKTPTDFTAPPTPNIITLNPFKTDPRRAEENRVLVQIKKVMAKEILLSIIDLEVKDNLVIIRFPGSAAFASGTADLAPEFMPSLGRIGEVLKSANGRIFISGHTDDVPISTERFRSNWDLSAARAVSVAHYLLADQIDAKRVIVQGAADSQPLLPNDSPENRARNRRVEIALEIPVDKQ
ncbi:OmpA family protein [Shumkonia mesophila]|uniref:OmpA family protein n=1 Tax=Shumkonia mesophila TaxID=2838854 RepID=UPI0029345994|nr:OmpA family protein [Shumkonia mesophila]